MNNYQLSFVDNVSEFQEMLPIWNDLLERSGKSEFFQQHHWLSLWWQLYAQEEDRLAIIVVKADGQVIAIAPFYVKKQNKISELRFIGTGENEAKEVVSEYLDIIVDNSCSDHIVGLIAEFFIDDLRGIQRICFDNVLAGSWVSCLGMHLKVHYFCNTDTYGVRYKISLPKTWDEYINSIDSKSLRHKIKKNLRRFEKLGNGQFQVVSDFSLIQPLIPVLVRLHQKRWNLKGKPGAFYTKEFVEFHQSLIRTLCELDQIRFLKIQVGEEVVGIFYYFVFDGCCYYYQSGINDRFKPNVSPGILGHSLMIQYCIDNGYQYYDFMKGPKEKTYKNKFSDTNIEMIGFIMERKNVLGMLHVYKNAIKSFLKQIVK